MSKALKNWGYSLEHCPKLILITFQQYYILLDFDKNCSGVCDVQTKTKPVYFID